MGKRKERTAIIFLNDQLKMAGEVLTEAELGRLVNMLRAYSLEGELPDLAAEGPLFLSIFGMMRSAQDKAIAEYEETCERNRMIAAKRYGRVVTSGNESLPVAPCVTNIIEPNQIKNKLIVSEDVSPSLVKEVGVTEETGVTGVTGVGWL